MKFVMLFGLEEKVEKENGNFFILVSLKREIREENHNLANDISAIFPATLLLLVKKIQKNSYTI